MLRAIGECAVEYLLPDLAQCPPTHLGVFAVGSGFELQAEKDLGVIDPRMDDAVFGGLSKSLHVRALVGR